MGKSLIKMLFPAFTLIVSLVWFFLGTTSYGMWNTVKGPERGFFPAIIAVLLFCASLYALVRSVKGKMPVFRLEELYLIAAAVSIYAGTFLVGLLPILLVYCVLWLRFLEKYPWKTTLTVTIVLSVVVYGVFVVWLGVLFPWGIFEPR